MPSKPLRPCNSPGCPELVQAGYCEKHKKQDAKQYDKKRGSAHERGYTSQWQKYRLRFLREHPLCARCEAEGRVVAASVVDHIKPHKGDMILFWDVSNHQPLCKTCHGVKTAKEDGGFNNPIG